jgi:hypothetical protein
MVVLSRMLPTDPDEREQVRRVLREHPALEAFIERLGRHAAEVFPGAKLSLDTRQYDDWDPPIQVRVVAPLGSRDYGSAYLRLLEWVNADPDYDSAQVHMSLRAKRQTAA